MNIIEKWIPVVNLESLKEKMNKLMKKAEKFGTSIFFRVTDETKTEKFEAEDGHKFSVEFKKVEVGGDNPCFNGWTFLAVLEPVDDQVIIKSVPGTELPEKYRGYNTLYCDHCKTDRQRKQVFIVQHVETKEYKQVGSTCVADFLGHGDPASIVERYFRIISSIYRDLDEFMNYDKGIMTFDIITFLAYIHAEAMKNGWTSATSAREMGTTSTAVQSWDLVSGYVQRHYPKYHYEPSEDNFKWASDALSWAHTIDSYGNNDYMYNLTVACNRQVVDYRTYSLVGSLFASYSKHIERELQRIDESKSEYVGTEGQREKFVVTCMKIIPISSFYGTKWIHKFRDAAGNIIMWFANTDALDLKPGETYHVKARVEKHETYKDVKQTKVSRVALEKTA